MSTNLASPAIHRLRCVISDFSLPSGTESGEAALRRLLASRAIGGYVLTSDGPAPGRPTVFQSSRVARPQDASKAPGLVSLLSSSARFHLDAYKQRMLRPVSEVADMETAWDRPVPTLIQSSRTADVTTWTSFVIWRKLGPSGLLKRLLNTLVSSSLPRRLGLRGSSATGICLNPPSELLLTKEVLCQKLVCWFRRFQERVS